MQFYVRVLIRGFGLCLLFAVFATVMIMGPALGQRRVFTWGANSPDNWLGVHVVSGRSAPARINAFSDVIGIAAGNAHSLAIKQDGTVWAWGRNGNGELGDGTTAEHDIPVKAIGLSGVSAVAAQGATSLALKSDGTVWVWGKNDLGQLGIGGPDVYIHSTPIHLSSLTNISAIATSGDHCLALSADGSVWAWGSNRTGQIGTLSGNDQYSPVQITTLTNVIKIAAGSERSMALTGDGSVWIWGHNDSAGPMKMTGLSSITAIAASYPHGLAVKSDGTLWMIKELTTGGPPKVTQNPWLNNVKTVVSGMGHDLAMKYDGTTWAWGDNSVGELGTGTKISNDAPRQTINITQCYALSAGGGHTLALLNDGHVWSWGDNTEGQLGALSSHHQASPVPLSLPLPGVSSLAIGPGLRLAVQRNGGVLAWAIIISDNLATVQRWITIRHHHP